MVFNESNLDPDNRVVLSGEKRPSYAQFAGAAVVAHAGRQAARCERRRNVSLLSRFVRHLRQHRRASRGFRSSADALVVSPSARYYHQTAADFYGIQFPGDPINDPDLVPGFYSADYRLSELETFTLGLEANIKLREHLDLHLGYQRYWMRGLDHETDQSTYPKANIFTVGLTYTF